MSRKTLTVEQDSARRFRRDSARHQLTVLHDDGLYRHLRFMAPTTRAYWFDLVTWPGKLTITGDMETFVFERERDMFPFFRSRDGINPHYWAQKEISGAKTREYSEQVFQQTVWAEVREYGHETRGLAKAVQAEIFDPGYSCDEDSARRALDGFEHDGFRFHDNWELSFSDYNYHFLWCCHAIVFGINRYDRVRRYGLQALAVPKAAAA